MLGLHRCAQTFSSCREGGLLPSHRAGASHRGALALGVRVLAAGSLVDPWVRKIPSRGKRQPAPVFFPGKIPWTEELGGLQSVGSQRVGHDWVGPHTHYSMVVLMNLARGLKSQTELGSRGSHYVKLCVFGQYISHLDLSVQVYKRRKKMYQLLHRATGRNEWAVRQRFLVT